MHSARQEELAMKMDVRQQFLIDVTRGREEPLARNRARPASGSLSAPLSRAD